jgi:hypothetical protein
VKNQLVWPENFRHHQEGDGSRLSVHKIYFAGESIDQGAVFEYNPRDLVCFMANYRMSEDYCEWTWWMRSEFCRAVCAPRPVPREFIGDTSGIDLEAAEKAFWGFGRPNLYKPHAPVHQLLSGALVDYAPEAVPANRAGWSFRPVFIKVQPNGGDSYTAKFYPRWGFGPSSVLMEVEINPSDVPPELADYEFRPRASELRAAREEALLDDVAERAVRFKPRRR